MLNALYRFGKAGLGLLRANVARLPRPLKINFAVTYWCQYQCKTCNIWKMQPRDELSTEELIKIFDRNNWMSWLDIMGGEIFLRRDIDEVLRHIADRCRHLVVLHFATNGYLTDKIVATCEKLARKGIPRFIVTVSLDGPESLNDEIRGIKGGYKRQIETFNALRKIRSLHPVLGMTISRLNAGRFEETFAACARDCPGLTISDFHLNLMQVSSHYYSNADLANAVAAPPEARKEMAAYRKMQGTPRGLAGWVESRFLKNLEDFIEARTTPMPCHSLRSSCFIDPWGKVYPCISYERPLGSIRDTDFRLAPIWETSQTRRVQQEIWRGDCPQCWTACEAYQTILGNALTPWRRTRSKRRAGESNRLIQVSIDQS